MHWTYYVIFSCLVAGVVVAEKPVLRPNPESVEKSQNESYVVFCSAGKENVTWTGPNGKPIPTTTGRVHVENRQNLGHALLFDHIFTSDQGRYTCTSISKEKASFHLSVVKTSKFLNTATEHYVNEFQNTVIRCEAVGEPKPIISWLRNGKSVDGLTDKKYLPDEGAKGLRVTNATKSDSGVYTCRALQQGKDENYIKTLDITLKVLHKPEWKDAVVGNTIVYGYLGGETNITCDALAQPEPVYTWSRHNKDVRTLPLNVTEIVEPSRSILQIQVQNESVFGHYQCQARNKLGSISRMFELHKGEKPDPPTSIQVGVRGVHTASLHIEGGGGGPENLQGYRVQFVITRPGEEISWDRPEYQDLLIMENGGFMLKDLLENTPYTVRAAARGRAGLSDYSTVTATLRTLKIGEEHSLAGPTAILSTWIILPLTLVVLTVSH